MRGCPQLGTAYHLYPKMASPHTSCVWDMPVAWGSVAGRLFFDLLNEPDAFNFTWSQTNTNSNGQNANSTVVEPWGTLFTDTAAALLEQEPALLFFAEGTGQKNQPGTAYGTSSMQLCLLMALYWHSDAALLCLLQYCFVWVDSLVTSSELQLPFATLSCIVTLPA